MGTSQGSPELLCEGALGAFMPEVAYVRQDDKVLFLLGEQALTESLDDGANIVESMDDLELEEREIGGKKVKYPKNSQWFVEGPFQRSDVKNANNRIYARKIWERLVGDAKSATMKMVTDRAMIGHLEHPKDGRTDGKEGALVTTSLKLKEDGVVWGKAELLDTPNGLILQEYTRKKIKWGVSSRGNGTVKDDGHVNENDYTLEAFDGVMRPSTPGAHPKPVTSSESEEPTGAAPPVVEDDINPEQGAGTPSEEEELTEDAQATVDRVTSLVETDLEDLDEGASAKLTGEILANLGTLIDLAKEGKLKAERAYTMQGWLTDRLKALQESQGVSAETIIERAIEGVDTEEDEEKAAAFRKVVESFQSQISSLTEDLETATSEVETLEGKLADAEIAVSLITTERDELLQTVETKDRQLAVALASISSESEEEVKDPVEAAVAEAILKKPGLSEFRDVLMRAEDDEEVERLVESLLPAIPTSEPIVEDDPPGVSPKSRRALPRGDVISEVKGGKPKPAVSESRGARVAGKALSNMKGGE